MGQDHAPEVAALREKTEVGDDNVDSEMFLSGKHDSRVDDYTVSALAIEHHVHPELAQAAERDDLDM
jgi:hypothetical protein